MDLVRRIWITCGVSVALLAFVTSIGVAAGTTEDAVQARSPVSRGAVRCVDSISTLPSVAALHSGYRTILGRVGLPSGRAPLSPVRATSFTLPFWRKFGLLVRTGSAPVEISVARGSAEAAVVWDNQGDDPPATHLYVDACSNAGQGDPSKIHWLGYPGGIYVRTPGCVHLIVRVGTRRAHISLDISARADACATR